MITEYCRCGQPEGSAAHDVSLPDSKGMERHEYLRHPEYDGYVPVIVTRNGTPVHAVDFPRSPTVTIQAKCGHERKFRAGVSAAIEQFRSRPCDDCRTKPSSG